MRRAVALLREALSRFLTDGRLEADNNIAENAIRGIALGRKNYLFAVPTPAASAPRRRSDPGRAAHRDRLKIGALDAGSWARSVGFTQIALETAAVCSMYYS